MILILLNFIPVFYFYYEFFQKLGGFFENWEGGREMTTVIGTLPVILGGFEHMVTSVFVCIACS